MTCREIENILPGYLDQGLNTEEERLVAEHLATCEACRATLVELKRSVSLAKGLPDATPPEWLKAKVMEQVHADAKAKRRGGLMRKLFWPLHIKIPLQAMATVLVAIFAFYLYRAGAPEVMTPGLHTAPAKESVSAPSGGVAPEDRTAQSAAPQAQATRYQARAPEPERKGARMAGMQTAPATSEESKEIPALRENILTEKPAPVPAPSAPVQAMEKDAWQPKAEQAPSEKLAKARAPTLGMAVQKAAPLSDAPAPPLTITVANLRRAGDALEKIVHDLNGRSAILERNETSITVSVTLAPEQLPALMAKLAELGTLKPSQSKQGPRADTLIIRLETHTGR